MSDTIYTPGLPIENETGAEGALGCFARRRGDGAAVLLSNAHVLFANATSRRNVKIYQPPSSTSCCRNEHIATTLNTWQQGYYRVRVDVGGTVHEGSETDCAIARLEAGIRFTNEHPQLGMIAGTPAPGGLGLVPGPPDFDTPPTADQYVRLFSPMTQTLRYGTVLRNAGTAGTYVEGGSGPVPEPLLPVPSTHTWPEGTLYPPINQFMVMPRPAPGEGYEAFLRGGGRLEFGRPGDSGSIVLNHLGQVVGLFAQSPPRPDISGPQQLATEWQAVRSLGLVNPIHRVLDQMEIDIPANFSSTSPSRGKIFAFSRAPADPEAAALEEGRDRLRAALSATRFGRFLLGKFSQHRREVRRVVFGVRQATLTWHRYQGPAFIDHLLRGLRDPQHPIPTVLNGVRRDELLARIAEQLIHHGHPKLRRDVSRHRDLLRHVSDLSRLDQVAERVAELRRPRSGSKQGKEVPA